VVLVGVLALAVAYGMGWRRARASGTSHPPSVGRLSLFALGLSAIVAALVSPLDSLGDQLMVMHMVQHILLLDIAPILLILGLTKVLLRPVTRRVQAIERRAGFVAHPAFAVLLYAGLLWLWHIPAMYDRPRATAWSTSWSTPASSASAYSTGGTCCRRSAAATGSGGWDRWAT